RKPKGVPEGMFGRTGIVYWDDRFRPASHEEAEAVAVTDSALMTLWGRAWDYKPGIAVQVYLSIPPNVRDPDPTASIWEIEIVALPNMPQRIRVGLPERRYEFTPIVLKPGLYPSDGEIT